MREADLQGSTGSTYVLQGYSVALSADGNTALVGGPADDGYAGAAWVFTRSGRMWRQQGPKLVGSGATGKAQQGTAVALSADGNTALVGGPADDSGAGAAWVFTRSGGSWSQQGSKLVGSGASGAGRQGWSVALSADGDTVLVGGPYDAATVLGGFAGAAWVYTRSGGTWSQQGSKLVGSGADVLRGAHQGFSVALSGDGDIALLGGVSDDGGAGAAWVFTRSGGSWSQEGSKLVGSGRTGRSQQGWSVAPQATATRRWSEAPRTTTSPGRLGSSPVLAAAGASRARSWSARARSARPTKASAWR